MLNRDHRTKSRRSKLHRAKAAEAWEVGCSSAWLDASRDKSQTGQCEYDLKE